jgi:hypothetical protein
MRTRTLGLVSLIVFATATYGLNHGVFVGSKTFVDSQWLIKQCRYLHFAGVETYPARGGDSLWDMDPPAPTGSVWVGDPDRADELRCPIFYR